MTQTPSNKHILPLVGWVSLVVAAAVLGAFASADAANLYVRLLKPAWAPPAGLFGPVWTVLYAMMAVAVCMVWRAPPGAYRTTGLVLFVVQLVLNALWSWLFFAWRNGQLAFIDVVALLVLVAATALVFRKVHPKAALLLVPYFLWVAFASALTWFVWHANPGVL